MTNQHPLTDDIIRYDKKLGCQDFGTWIYTENDLRAAADWQLEKVLEWLITNTEDYLLQDYYKTYFLTRAFLDDFKKAMRPTSTQEDN